MTRQRHKKTAPAPRAAKPAPVAPAAPEKQSRSLRYALDNAPHDPRPLDMQLATAYRVDPKNYTDHERNAAEHALDFNNIASSALSFVENTSFPGFPTLALLAQLSEYRSMAETLAEDCIRMWGRVVSAGEADDKKCQAIEAELERIDLSSIVKLVVEHDQLYGGAHVYIKLKNDEDVRDLPLLLKPYSVPQGSFEGLRVVEPYWVTPNFYNSIDPTAADFYKPSSWWMLGTETHATRLHTVISRPVADMLKPAYSFRGVSLTQLAMPYVGNWLRTRQSVSDAVKQFAVSGVLTDLQQALLPDGGQDLSNRAALINAYRDNRNLLFLDKATEEYFTSATPLSGLDALQAQAQEQQAAVARTPLVKLLGITPSGLNASSDGEVRVYYDRVHGYQEHVLSPLVMTAVRIAQLSLFGEIDDDICWEWTQLHEMTELELAEVRNKDADTDTRYVEAGIVRPDQVTKRLSTDPESLYAGIMDESIEDIPDDDIGAITEKILEIGAESEPASNAVPGAGNPVGAQGGIVQQEEQAPAEGAPDAHAATLTPAHPEETEQASQ